MADARAGAILAVADVERSVAFYRDAIGLEVEALYDDPPYATLALAGARLSLAEQGHPADDRPGVAMAAPADPVARRTSCSCVEVDDARAEHARLARKACASWPSRTSRRGAAAASSASTRTGYLVEIEQPA